MWSWHCVISICLIDVPGIYLAAKIFSFKKKFYLHVFFCVGGRVANYKPIPTFELLMTDCTSMSLKALMMMMMMMIKWLYCAIQTDPVLCSVSGFVVDTALQWDESEGSKAVPLCALMKLTQRPRWLKHDNDCLRKGTSAGSVNVTYVQKLFRTSGPHIMSSLQSQSSMLK